jgi:hypothetical protein
MSLTLLAPIGEPFGTPAGPWDLVTLAADAGWFGDDSVVEAAQLASETTLIQPARAYQFGLIADPQIYIELTMTALQLLGPNLAASALWDGLKHLLGRRRVPTNADPSSRTVINFTVVDRGWSAAVETDDPEVARQAIEALSAATNTAINAARTSGSVPPARWDADSRKWREVSDPADPKAN